MIKLNKKSGFTLLEVTLFIALSGFLMIGLIAGANISISRQRYNDTVNSLVEYISSTYNEVLNVSTDRIIESEKPGRTTYAVYGKLITFGEDLDSMGTGTSDVVYSYDVVGKAISSAKVTSSSTLDMLKNEVEANIVIDDNGGAPGTTPEYKFYQMDTFTIPWDGYLQVANNPDPSSVRFRGALLIVRSPATGSVRTYIYEGSVTDFHNSEDNHTASGITRFRTLLPQFHEDQLDICVESDDNNHGNRQNVRIIKRASNSSGVILANFDEPYSASNKDGSRCTGQI